MLYKYAGNSVIRIQGNFPNYHKWSSMLRRSRFEQVFNEWPVDYQSHFELDDSTNPLERGISSTSYLLTRRSASGSDAKTSFNN